MRYWAVKLTAAAAAARTPRPGGGVAEPQAGVVARRDGLGVMAGRGAGAGPGGLDRASRRRAGGLGGR